VHRQSAPPNAEHRIHNTPGLPKLEPATLQIDNDSVLAGTGRLPPRIGNTGDSLEPGPSRVPLNFLCNPTQELEGEIEVDPARQQALAVLLRNVIEPVHIFGEIERSHERFEHLSGRFALPGKARPLEGATQAHKNT
jgi:hypothetical protein